MAKKDLTVKEQVRAYLKTRKMTQAEFADELGIAASHLSEVLNGKTPSLHVAVRLEELTGIAARHFAVSA